MKNNNEHVFSEEYNEKKAVILDCIEKTEKPAVGRAFPLKIIIAATVLCVILASSVLAAGVIGRQFKMNVDYLPEGVDEMISAEERIEFEGFPSLEYYVVDLKDEEFTPIEETSPDEREGIEYEVFTVNGHYAQIIHYVCWDPEEDFEEFTNKQLIVYFEEEELLIQIWATNLISMEELRNVAEGLSFEPTDDGSISVKMH